MRRLAVLLAIIALLLGGCGSEGSGGSEPGGGTTTETGDTGYGY